MDTATIVNIILCILSFILAVISVVTVVITLRQNAQMIESSTRPYISIYGITTNFGSPIYSIVVKNFGNSSAKITKFYCNVDLSAISYDPSHIPFDKIEGLNIVPGQSLICDVKYDELKNLHSSIEFSITYFSNNKEYSENIPLNFHVSSSLADNYNVSKNSELQIISKTLQFIAKHNQ